MKIVSMFVVLRFFESDLSLFIVDPLFPLLNLFWCMMLCVGFRCFSSPIISPNLAFLKKETNIANHFSPIMKTNWSILFFITFSIGLNLCYQQLLLKLFLATSKVLSTSSHMFISEIWNKFIEFVFLKFLKSSEWSEFSNNE